MSNVFLSVHLISGLVFILFVLMQDKGTGLSASFGGTGTFYASQRGAAKVLHQLTIMACALFFLSAILTAVVPSKPEVTGATVESSAPVEVTPVP